MPESPQDPEIELGPVEAQLPKDDPLFIHPPPLELPPEKPDDFFSFSIKEMMIYTASASVGAGGARAMPDGVFAFLLGLLSAVIMIFVVFDKSAKRISIVSLWAVVICYVTACGTGVITNHLRDLEYEASEAASTTTQTTNDLSK